MRVKLRRSSDAGAAVDWVTVESGRMIDRRIVDSAVHQHPSPLSFHRVDGTEPAWVVPHVRRVKGGGQRAAGGGVVVPTAGLEAVPVTVEEEVVVGRLRRPKVRGHQTAVVGVVVVVQNARHRRHLRRHSVDAQLGRQRQPYRTNIQSSFTLSMG